MAPAPRLRLYHRPSEDGPHLQYLSPEHLFEMEVVARVLPFRVNNYVVEQLIDWPSAPDDPMFRLTFPDREMLRPADFDSLSGLMRSDAPAAEIEALVHRIRLGMNPHPAGQLTLNTPRNGEEASPACSTSTGRRC